VIPVILVNTGDIEGINPIIWSTVLGRLMDEVDTFVRLLWENIKFFAMLLSALITIDVYYTNILLSTQIDKPYIAILLAAISFAVPIVIISVAIIGHDELKCRWARLIETLTFRAKVETILGLHRDFSDKFVETGIFPGDKYIYQRFTEAYKSFSTSEDFIRYEVSPRKRGGHILREKNFYMMMSRIYLVFKAIGVLLLIVKIVLIVAVFMG